MPLFTFYLCQPDGIAASFETFSLADDAAASVHARRMLEEHPSCTYVDALCGERKVCTQRRMHAGAGLGLGRRPEGPRPA